MPNPPLRRTTSRVSAKNCPIIAPRVAPTALRTPISRVRSRTATSITFMTPMPPSISVTTPTAPRKYFMPLVILLKRGTPARCPDGGGLLVARVEAVQPAQGAAHLALAFVVHFERARGDDELADRVRVSGGLSESRASWH